MTAAVVEPSWRPIGIEDVRHALGEIKGVRELPAPLLKVIAAAFQVRGEGPVRLRVDRRAVGEVSVALIQVSEMRIVGLPFSAAHTVHVSFVLDGTVEMTPREGARVVLGPGAVALVSNWSLLDVACGDGTRVLHVLFPESRLRARGVRVRPSSFVLDGERGLAVPLLAMATALVDPSWRAGSSATRVLERTIEDLVVGLVLEWPDDLGECDDLRAGLRRRALEEIALRHRDQELDPTALARLLGVSLRHLQRAFEGSGTTVAEQLVRHRAESAAALLGLPGTDRLTISEIARASGFDSAFELRSAFRHRFGVLPSQFRSTGRSPATNAPQVRASAGEPDSDRGIVVSAGSQPTG